MPLEELTQRFHGPAPENAEAVLYEEVALKIRQCGQAGVNFLLAARHSADAVRLRAILFALGWPPLASPEVPSILLAYLRDDHLLVVSEAVYGLRLLGIEDVHDHVFARYTHESPYVRGAVLRYLARLFPDEARPMLLDALADKEYIVRENAVDEMEAVEALPAIHPLLADPHPDVRQAAEWVVENLGSLADSLEPQG